MDRQRLRTRTRVATAGRLADVYGRRRIYLNGLAVFTLSSLTAGLARSAGVLIPVVSLPIFRSRAFSGGIGTGMVWAFGVLGFSPRRRQERTARSRSA